MPKPKKLRVYTKLCKHVHVSGRRCSVRYGRNAFGDFAELCGLHKHGTCSDCHSMLEAFTPPKGWQEGIGDF